jgi:MFS family permease
MVDVPAPKLARATTGIEGRGRFEALKYASYRVLWISSTLIFFGIQAQQIARGWLAIELSGTNAGLGGVYLAFGLPMFVCGPIGGVVADRFSKRTVLTACQSMILAGALFIAIADGLGLLAYWMLLVASAVHGAGMAVMAPTRMAFTGEVVERRILPNAVVLQQLGINSTRVIGPAIAGALIGIESIGAGGVYIFTSAIIAISIGISMFLPDIPPRGRAGTESPIGELIDGLRYVRSRPQVMLLITVSTVVVMVGMTYLAFLPTVAADIFDVGSSGYGVMSAVGAIAAVVASFWIAGRVYRTSIWRLQSLCGVALSIGLILLAISPTYALALAALAFLGGTASGYQATNSSLVLTETALEYHGRVQSLMMTGWAASGIIALPLGIVADTVGLRETLFGMGVICLGAMAWYSVARRHYVEQEATLAF